MMKLALLVCLSICLVLRVQAVAFAQTPTQTTTADTSVSTPTRNASTVNAMQYLLQASALLYEQKNFTAAANILNTIDTASLSPDLQQRYVLQQAALALANNDSTKATSWLNRSILTDIPMNDTDKQISFHELRAQVFSLKKQFFDAAKEYLLLISIVPKIDQPPYVDALWDALSKSDIAILTDVIAKPSSDELHNWVELTLITKNASMSEEEQKAAIKKWFAMHPNHPIPSALIKIDTTLQSDKS